MISVVGGRFAIRLPSERLKGGSTNTTDVRSSNTGPEISWDLGLNGFGFHPRREPHTATSNGPALLSRDAAAARKRPLHRRGWQP